MHVLFNSDHRESPSPVPLANGMHRNIINYLMSCMYVPENKLKAAAYFPVSKNHVLTEIMLELSIHIYEKKPLSVPWAYFEHQSLVQLGKKLEGTVHNFENTRHFRSWVNSQAKLIRPVSF